jgi:hypothetical protein
MVKSFAATQLRSVIFASQSRFELRGVFLGFVHTNEGKRRLLLRVEDEEFRMKLPKDLRHYFGRQLVPGQTILVAGIERREFFTGEVKRTVTALFPDKAGAPPLPECTTCTVRICGKKNCWKSGGKALFHTLERKIEHDALTGTIKLKVVGCMDHCEQAPNLECGVTHLVRCTPEMAVRLVDSLTGKPASPPVGHAASA